MSEDQNIFDEDKAVAFIRKMLPKEVSGKYDDDEILNVIDMIWDYYDRSGFLSLDASDDDDEEIDVAKLVDYVRKQLRKDKEALMDPADVDLVVKAELEYEESLDDFI